MSEKESPSQAAGSTPPAKPGQGKRQRKKGGKSPQQPEGNSQTDQTKHPEQAKVKRPDEARQMPQKSGKDAQGAGKVPAQTESQNQAGSQDATAPAKSKAQLKAERRALQEAQRAAKAKQQADAGGTGKAGPTAAKQDAASRRGSVKKAEGPGSILGKGEAIRVPDKVQYDDEKTRKRLEKKLEKQNIPQRSKSLKQVALFSHLPQYERNVSLSQNIKFSSTTVHPAVLKLGLQYAKGVISGSNARCVALLAALKQVIADYSTPPQKELCRDLESKIKPCISFLNQCRPLSASMGNAIKQLKWHISHIPSTMSDKQAKELLFDEIHQFVEKIILAGTAISQNAQGKISDGDVIMVYGHSSLILTVLSDAHKNGINFSVIVADGRPKLEGREMLRKLVKVGIQCSYVLINGIAYVMKQVNKVLLGAHALLANGYVMSTVGSSQVALVAKSCNVPVLVCCETYKFCDRVQTDSFVFNELGDPSDLVLSESCSLDGWKDMPTLNVLNLTYDVTSAEYVTVVITELGMVPCSSVPVVLRVKHVESEI